MAGIPGSHANSLANPIPGADDAAAAMPAPMPMPQGTPPPQQAQAPAAAPAPAEAADQRPSLDAIFGGGDGRAPASAAKPSLDDIFGNNPKAPPSEPGLLDRAANDAQEMKGEFMQSFASNPEQKRKLLEAAYGKENVTKHGDEFKVMRDGKEIKVDRGMWDLVKDLSSAPLKSILGDKMYDKTKDAVKGATGIEMGDGMAGVGKYAAGLGGQATFEAAALGPELAGAAIGNLPGLAAGRIVGGMAGQMAKQKAASAMIGDSMDEPGALAGIVQGVTRATFGALGDKVLSAVSGKLAARYADEAAKKAALAKMPEKYLENQAMDIAETDIQLQALKDKGIIDKDAQLLVHQQTDSPEAKEAAKVASSSNTFRDLLDSQGKWLAEGWQNLTRITQRMRGVKDNVANQVLDKLNSADNAFASEIGHFRDQWIARGKKDFPYAR
jgi:hypothetical protein